jgi:hypothetical protein
LQTLTIGAASLESALGFLDSLRGFRTDLVETEDGHHEVRITVYGDRDIHEALAAIDRHVTERAEGPARLGLDGRHYLIESTTHR